MTEEEWLACNEPHDMLWPAFELTSQRRSRLLACACYRRWVVEAGESGSQILAAAERFADAEHTSDCDPEQHALDARDPAIPDHLWMATKRLLWRVGPRLNLWESPADVNLDHRAKSQSLQQALEVLGVLNGFVAYDRGGAATLLDRASQIAAEYHRRQQESAAQADLARDIFGNPFRPVTFSPEWRTDTALLLARQMYESRDFSAMPILADALQDAGCDSEEVLSHCRDANRPHVRGCWVVDLVLGKK